MNRRSFFVAPIGIGAMVSGAIATPGPERTVEYVHTKETIYEESPLRPDWHYKEFDDGSAAYGHPAIDRMKARWLVWWPRNGEDGLTDPECWANCSAAVWIKNVSKE